MNPSNLHALEFGKTTIRYRLSYSKRETLAIHVHPDLSVSVDAPEDSDFKDIEPRIRKRAAWILRHQENFRRYSVEFPPRQYVSGEAHRFLGQQYRLKVIQNKLMRESVEVDRDQIIATVQDKANRKRTKNLVMGWYRQQAAEILADRVHAWLPHFEKYGISKPRVVVRQMRLRWGSCTAKGLITLNLKLVMVPKQLIDYVIVHELCHLVEHNHASAFYALMSKIMPDWERRKEKLNGFEF